MYEPHPELEAAFKFAFSEDYFRTRIKYYETHEITAKENKFGKPEEFLYNNKRYQECITYIQSHENFYSDHYISCLIKAYIKMGNYSSAKDVADLYTTSKSSKEEKDKTMRCLNDVIESTHPDEIYIAEKLLDSHLSVEDLSYNSYPKGMFAKRKIEMGETILIEAPMFSVGNGKCAHCFHDSALSKCCANCKNLYYCSEDCQSNHAIHERLCKLYKPQTTAPYAMMALDAVFKKMLKHPTITNEDMFDLTTFKTLLMGKSAFKDLLNTSCELITYALAVTVYAYNRSRAIYNQPLFKDVNGKNQDCTYSQLGAIMLRTLIFCKYKSVLLFDNVLGTSNEFYPKLSRFQFSCQPNTIISRIGDEVVLKASRDIKMREEIRCSYFDMLGNTTFFDVLNNEDAMSTLRLNCESDCKCQKSPYNCLSTQTNNIDADCKFKRVPAESKCFLQMIISNSRIYLKSRDPELLYSTFKKANEVILNKNHLLLQGIYFEVIKHEFSLKNFDNAHQHLPIIMNTSHIQFFKRIHAELFFVLLHHTKSVFGKKELPLSLLEVLRDYWKFIEEDVCPRYPNEMLFDIVKSFYEVFPMKATVA